VLASYDCPRCQTRFSHGIDPEDPEVEERIAELAQAHPSFWSRTTGGKEDDGEV
jgi:hypothetical protein